MKYVITVLGNESFHVSRDEVEGVSPSEALYNSLMDTYSPFLDELEGEELSKEISDIRKHAESGKVVGPAYYVQDHDELGFFIVEEVK